MNALDGIVTHLDGTAVVTMCGEIDAASTPTFFALVDQAVNAAPHVVFDMRDVWFMDSSGLAVFEYATREQQRRGGTITVRQPSRAVMRTMEITGLDRLVMVDAFVD